MSRQYATESCHYFIQDDNCQVLELGHIFAQVSSSLTSNPEAVEKSFRIFLRLPETEIFLEIYSLN